MSYENSDPKFTHVINSLMTIVLIIRENGNNMSNCYTKRPCVESLGFLSTHASDSGTIHILCQQRIVLVGGSEKFQIMLS